MSINRRGTGHHGLPHRPPVGASRTATLYLDGLSAGLSGFNVSLAIPLPDPSTGEIVSVCLPGWRLNSTTALPADTVVISALDLEGIAGPGADALIGNVTVRGDRVGQTELRVTAARVDDETGERVKTRLAACAVDVGPAPYLACVPSSPGDLDGDGLYDDLNGNGRRDFADVVVYFNHIGCVTAYEDWAYFDNNRNGRIDFADIICLFNQL